MIFGFFVFEKDDIRLQQAVDALREVYYKTLAYCESTRNVNIALQKVDEAVMWLRHQLFLPRQDNSQQPSLFDNPPQQDNPNKSRLFDGGNTEPVIIEEPKEKKQKIKKEKTAEVIEEKKASVQLPSKEEVIFMAKEYTKKHGDPEAFLKVLETFGAAKISEVFEKGDTAVMNLVEALKI